MATPLPRPEETSGASGWSRMWHSPFGRWLLLSLMWILLATITAAQMAMSRDINWQGALDFSLSDWGPWIVLSPLVLWFARKVQIDGRNWRYTLPAHIIAAFGIAIVAQLIGFGIYDLGIAPSPERSRPRPSPSGEVLPPPPPAPRPSLRFVRARFSMPIYCVLVAAAHAVAYHRRSLERERRALAAEARLTEARLMALQTQLHPHFLFNTLNTISSLIYTQPRHADEMICALGELLHAVLDSSEQREVTLAGELAMVDRYLRIQQIRFTDRLVVRYERTPETENAAVPPLILQPLVENAVLHGIVPHSRSGSLTVAAQRQNDRLILTVIDTGSGIPGTMPTPSSADLGEVRTGVGLRNTRARLAAMYGDDARLTLEPTGEGGMCARLDLPFRRSAVV